METIAQYQAVGTKDADILLSMKIGEEKSLREESDEAIRRGFSYTRLPDVGDVKLGENEALGGEIYLRARF